MKRLLLLLAGLLVLVSLAVFIYVKARPSAKEFNPISTLDANQIEKVLLESPANASQLQLEQKGGVWKLTAPLQDDVEKTTVTGLMDKLRNFRAGSVVSSNKAKYEKFDLTDQMAVHVRVYEVGKSSPTLDVFVGKKAVGWSDSFVRFAGQDDVYIAMDLPSYFLTQPAHEFRQKTIFPESAKNMNSLEIKKGPDTWAFSRSGSTWTYVQQGKMVDGAWMDSMVASLNALRAFEFGTGSETVKDLGFEKPYCQIKLDEGGQLTNVAVGNKLASSVKTDNERRYAQSQGRPAVLVFQARSLEEFLQKVKTPPAN